MMDSTQRAMPAYRGPTSRPLADWWLRERRPPITVRRIRLTDSPHIGPGRAVAAWSYGWQVTCHMPHPGGHTWTWNYWQSAMGFMFDHLISAHGIGIKE